MIVDARFRIKFWIEKGTGGNEKLANGVLCILDGWAANRKANFMAANLVLNFARTSGLAMGKLAFNL